MTFSDIVGSVVGTILSPLIPLTIAVALVLFFWGLVKYIGSSAGSSKSEGRSLIWWGVITLFIMISVWGLVTIIRESVPGLTGRNLHQIPMMQ